MLHGGCVTSLPDSSVTNVIAYDGDASSPVEPSDVILALKRAALTPTLRPAAILHATAAAAAPPPLVSTTGHPSGDPRGSGAPAPAQAVVRRRGQGGFAAQAAARSAAQARVGSAAAGRPAEAAAAAAASCVGAAPPLVALQCQKSTEPLALRQGVSAREAIQQLGGLRVRLQKGQACLVHPR